MSIMGVTWGEIALITLGNLKYFCFSVSVEEFITLVTGCQTLGRSQNFVMVIFSYC